MRFTDTLLRPDLLDDLLAKEPAFRRFYFGLIGARLSDLALAVEAVAFLKLDQRIAALLVEKGPRVTLTHQAMADRLGVAREMVSRVMRGFAHRAWVAQSREFIEVTDIAALERWRKGAWRICNDCHRQRPAISGQCRDSKKEARTIIQLFEPESSTYTYILADDVSREAAIVDPVLGQDDPTLEP